VAGTSEPLRLLSIGAGAIGTYIGGSLALGGHQVVVVASHGMDQSVVMERPAARGALLPCGSCQACSFSLAMAKSWI